MSSERHLPEPGPERVVAVTGAAGGVGRRVVALVAAMADVDRVVAVDRRQPPTGGPGCEAIAVDLAGADLKPVLEDVDTLVHLAFAYDPEIDEAGAASLNLEGTRRLLDAAGAVGVQHLVVVSSAAVYGAWPDNPVPLTEEAPLRPNPGFGYAVQKAEIERLCREWVDEHPGTSLAVLRPSIAVGEHEESWLARCFRTTTGIRTGHEDPPIQLVHLDDLAAAVALAVARRLDGAYNVAADRWLSGEEVRALTGVPTRLPVPGRLATAVAGWGWRRRVGAPPPGLLPYTQHPWVVANGRLRAAGWEPAHSNEEILVEAREGPPWTRVSPKRRQELILGGAGALLAGAVAAVVALLRRRR